jgi:hypothetical protein
LRNIELDEAGKLAAFRERFGRVYDAAAQPVEGEVEGGEAAAAAAAVTEQDAEQVAEQAAAEPAKGEAGLNFEDLLAEYSPQDTSALKDSGPKKSPTRRK